MATVSVNVAPVSALERLLEMTRQLGVDELEAILACSFTFDGSYFQQFLDALAALGTAGADRLREIPIDVMCDYRHYRSHGGTYNVHCWPGPNLFHPKLLMLLFSDRVVWLEGSQNLTRSGYAANQELVSLHVTTMDRLPHGVHALVGRLAEQRIEAARAVADVTTRAALRSANRSLTSLEGEILQGLLKRVRAASDVYLVAPFFDRREQGGPSIESAALKRLADHYPAAKFWVYLPQVASAEGRPVLQASQKTFAEVFGPRAPMRRLVLCGVPSDQHPLHAKLLAVRHGPRDATVTVLTGSPNITEKALFKKGAGGNVELARELTLKWSRFEPLLAPLAGRFKKIEDCRFEAPTFERTAGWHAVESATYHPVQGTLEIRWCRPDVARATRIEYAGRAVSIPADGRCAGFVMSPNELRLETICRADPRLRSWCPIVIPFESRIALGSLPDRTDPPPEWWLAQLGALPLSSTGAEGGSAGGGTRAEAATTRYPLAVRIRDLANRMRYVQGVITEPGFAEQPRVNSHLALLEKIFAAHDPAQAGDPQERTWRMWVRLELTQLLQQSARVHRRRALQTLAGRFRTEMSAMQVPADLAELWRELTGDLP
jgi:hypothetical protein